MQEIVWCMIAKQWYGANCPTRDSAPEWEVLDNVFVRHLFHTELVLDLCVANKLVTYLLTDLAALK